MFGDSGGTHIDLGQFSTPVQTPTLVSLQGLSSAQGMVEVHS